MTHLPPYFQTLPRSLRLKAEEALELTYQGLSPELKQLVKSLPEARVVMQANSCIWSVLPPWVGSKYDDELGKVGTELLEIESTVIEFLEGSAKDVPHRVVVSLTSDLARVKREAERVQERLFTEAKEWKRDV